MRGRFKPWAAPYLEAHPEVALKTVSKDDPFFKDGPLYLEIGIGKGDFILGLSSIQEGNYLGLERDISIIGIAAKKVIESEKTNIRLRAADFDIVFEELKGIKFDKIYLNFSDPWPKKRHSKRRLTTVNRLQNMMSLLKNNGVIAMKTDNPILYEWTVEQVPLAGLKLLDNQTNYQLEETDVASEYEKNFRSQGKPIYRLIIGR